MAAQEIHCHDIHRFVYIVDEEKHQSPLQKMWVGWSMAEWVGVWSHSENQNIVVKIAYFALMKVTAAAAR